MLTRSGTVMEDNIRVVARWWPLPENSVWLNFCRFRPLNSKELEAGDESVVSFPETQHDREVSLLVTDKTEKGKGEKKERKFTFDKILKPTVTQSQVYEATAKNIVKGENTYSIVYLCSVRLFFS